MAKSLEVGVLHLLRWLSNIKKTHTLSFSILLSLEYGHHRSRHGIHIQRQEGQGGKRFYVCSIVVLFRE